MAKGYAMTKTPKHSYPTGVCLDDERGLVVDETHDDIGRTDDEPSDSGNGESTPTSDDQSSSPAHLHSQELSDESRQANLTQIH